jgi:hypothetical protein
MKMETHICRSAIFLFIFIYFLFFLGKLFDPSAKELISYGKEKTSVELFVMSRCPDAVACEEVMAEVGA